MLDFRLRDSNNLSCYDVNDVFIKFFFKVKDGPADQKISHSVACTVSTSKVCTVVKTVTSDMNV